MKSYSVHEADQMAQFVRVLRNMSMEWTKGILIVPALFLCGCGESYEATYSKPYVAVCSGVRNNWFREIDTERLNKRVNDYVNHGYTVSGNLIGTRGEICQTLERISNE